MTSGAWTSSPTNWPTVDAFRPLTVINLITRECLAIDVGPGLRGRDVVGTLERLRFERGLAATHPLRQRHCVLTENEFNQWDCSVNEDPCEYCD